MRIGVISDTHGSVPAEVYAHFDGVERILHAGDLDEPGVLRELQHIAPVDAVRGNMDGFAAARQLPLRRVVEAGNARMGLLHGHTVGSPGNKHRELVALFREDNIQAVVYGHTHIAVNERIDGVLVFNPGSASRPRTGDPPSIGLFDITDGRLEAQIIALG